MCEGETNNVSIVMQRVHCNAMRPHGDVYNQSFGGVGCVTVTFAVMVRLQSHNNCPSIRDESGIVLHSIVGCVVACSRNRSWSFWFSPPCCADPRDGCRVVTGKAELTKNEVFCFVHRDMFAGCCSSPPVSPREGRKRAEQRRVDSVGSATDRSLPQRRRQQQQRDTNNTEEETRPRWCIVVVHVLIATASATVRSS